MWERSRERKSLIGRMAKREPPWVNMKYSFGTLTPSLGKKNVITKTAKNTKPTKITEYLRLAHAVYTTKITLLADAV